MAEWVKSLLDIALILMVGTGLYRMGQLIAHLKNLKQNQIDMERFVRDFNTTVMRAEAGISGLRTAAKERGEDLERLVDKATLLRDELNFLVESADFLATRLTNSASATRGSPEDTLADSSHHKTAPRSTAPAPTAPPKPSATPTNAPAPSRAEQELLQALKKLT